MTVNNKTWYLKDFCWSKKYLTLAKQINEIKAKWDNNLPIEKRRELSKCEDELYEQIKVAELEYISKKKE